MASIHPYKTSIQSVCGLVHRDCQFIPAAPERRDRRNEPMKFLRALLYLIALPAIMGVLFGYFGSVHPALDTLSHFRLHLAVIAAAGGLLLMLVRRKALGSLLIFSALFSLVFHISQFGDPLASPLARQLESRFQTLIGDRIGLKLPVRAEPLAGGARYTLLHANLWHHNTDVKEFLRLAGEVSADVMTLNEVSAQWRPALDTLRAAYPNQLVCEDDSIYGGLAILSKRPFVESAENGCSDEGALALQHVDFGGREAVVGTAHLLWPWPHGQARQIGEMRERLRANSKSGLPLIFAGDLNAVSWSHSVKRIASFLDAKRLTVPGGSWLHRTLPSQYIQRFGLPIDNVLTRGIDVTKIETLPPFGSDHLAVRAEFVLPLKPEKGSVAALAD
jgi:endonuclease/exonuclease/phosphatase (EEP) superfamily protein YafD